MQPDLLKLLRRYLRSREDSSPALFISNRLVPIDRTTLWRLMQTYGATALFPTVSCAFDGSYTHIITVHWYDPNLWLTRGPGEGKNEATYRIRLGIEGGGCNGYQYVLKFEDEYGKNDYSFTIGGELLVVVSKISKQYLEQTELDYVENDMLRGYVFNNPNATSTCGCQKSVGF